MFRELALDDRGIAGRLFLHGMPGECGELCRAWREIREKRIDRIVCLAQEMEIEEQAPDYAEARKNGEVPCAVEDLPVPDGGVPADREEFLKFVQGVADRLRAGEHVLVHCRAGIGRTGTFAICVLLALGWHEEQACSLVHAARSRPESEAQKALVKWFAGEVGGGA